ncbi:hypothetical protein D3C78_880180 [compost metagenome]
MHLTEKPKLFPYDRPHLDVSIYRYIEIYIPNLQKTVNEVHKEYISAYKQPQQQISPSHQEAS